MTSFTETIEVQGQTMAVYGGLPPGAGPFPGIVVIQHAPGVDTFIRSIVDRLAEAGYCALAPDLYHRLDSALEPMRKLKLLTDPEVIADVNATIAHLCARREVDPGRLGITGFCMGGRVAYLMAATNPLLKAAVVYYGGNIMVPWGEGVAAPFARTPQINCPLMFHFGAEDTNPSPDDMRALDAELTRHNKAHEFHVYPNAGHAFMNFANAERYREAAAKVSWPRTLAFLDRHLRR